MVNRFVPAIKTAVNSLVRCMFTYYCSNYKNLKNKRPRRVCAVFSPATSEKAFLSPGKINHVDFLVAKASHDASLLEKLVLPFLPFSNLYLTPGHGRCSITFSV